jgi:hypothetical protein
MPEGQGSQTSVRPPWTIGKKSNLKKLGLTSLANIIIKNKYF